MLHCSITVSVTTKRTVGSPTQVYGAKLAPAEMVSWPMAVDAGELRMVDAHIAQGARHVVRQKELIDWLKSRGHPTEVAEQLLREFRSTLRQHRKHRTKMMQQREPDPLLPASHSRTAPSVR